jgi:glycogen(starch) synthase
MRILHLTTEFPPIIYGGLGTAVGGWVHASARAGLAVAVLLVEGDLEVDGRAVHAYGYGYGHGQGGLAAVAQGAEEVVDAAGVLFRRARWAAAVAAGLELIRRWRADLLHLHTAMLWPVAEALQRLSGLPLVYHVHSVDRAEYEIGEEPNPWLAKGTAQDAAIGAADRLIAISESERALLAFYFPEVGARVRVVGNGIDDADPAASGAQGREHASAEPLILYSGRLVERKGLRELLDAASRVFACHPTARLVLAGGPPGCSGEQLADDWLPPELAPFRARVHFTGWLRADALARWYRSADLLVVPSRYEPFGMVVLEGMLHGLPVVAAAVGGPAEILTEGVTGLLFPPRDAQSLAVRILRLLADPALRRRLGRAARRDAIRRWSWCTRVLEMRAVYEELLPLFDRRAA